MPVQVLNEDGSWSPAQPIGWQEEHNWLARFIFWVRGIEHCNDNEGNKVVSGAREIPRYYGGDGTIHQTDKVNVELDRNGKVVSVWFRCALLPFDQTVVSNERAREMDEAYLTDSNYPPGIVGVEFNR